MAGNTTPPDNPTRYIETTRGVLTYSQIAPLLAEKILEIERLSESGVFSPSSNGFRTLAGVSSPNSR